VTADTLEPFQGYWVKVNGSGKLIFSASNRIENLNRIRIVEIHESPPGAPENVIPQSEKIQASFTLSQNYPNPFNPSTKFEFQIPGSSATGGGFVSLKIYDMLGREIADLVHEDINPGNYQLSWDASGQASGIYFYTLRAGELVEHKKLMIVR
jgi:hypothetical protein